MSDVAVVIIGRNHWGNLTFPFVNSIKTHEPYAQIQVIDVASEPHTLPVSEYLNAPTPPP